MFFSTSWRLIKPYPDHQPGTKCNQVMQWNIISKMMSYGMLFARIGAVGVADCLAGVLELPALVAHCLDSRFRKKSTQPYVAKSTIFGSLSGPRLWPCWFFGALQGAKEPTWHPLPVYHNVLDVLITVACMQAHEGRRGRADDRIGFDKVTCVFCNPAPSTDCFLCLYSTICLILS
jgi:hypothetical protein